MHSKITYRQQFTRCGKQRCRRCRDSEGHGPYWYAYWSEKGRTVSKYIGVHLPPEVIAAREAKGETTESITRADETLAGTGVSAALRVYLLGQFRVERKVKQEWKLVDSRTWQRRRARALLGCLLSSPSRRLGREQVMEQLWPDLDIDVASNRLNGAVHELRQILEPDLARPANSRLLRLERDILELADNTMIWVDVEEFENLLKEVEAIDTSANTDRAEKLLEEAEALYSGGYLLEELYSEWAAHRRDALQRRWVGLLLELAHIRVKRGAFVSAIETLDRLRVADPTNETALQRLMRLLTELDRRGEALQVYRQHKEMMRREYESEPLPETRALYESLRKGNLPSAQSVASQKERQQQKEVSLSVPPNNKPSPVVIQQDITFTRPAFQLGRHNQSPLVGRSQEQNVMQQLLLSIEAVSPLSSLDNNSVAQLFSSPQVATATASISVKQPHFLLLTGDSGIGKTRLAEEISSEANTRGWAVAWSRAYEQEGNIAYHSWIELLRILLQGIPNDRIKLVVASLDEDRAQTLSAAQLPLAIQLERLSTLLPEFALYNSASARLSLSYEQERLYLWEAVLALLNILSEIHPLLLILDDLHWSDESSIELLTYLTHHLQNQRVLLVGTCRDSELSPSHKLRALVGDLRRDQTIVTLAIEPLSQSQIGTLVSYLPQPMVESIQTQAAGNPFFAEELARYIEATTYQSGREDFSQNALFTESDNTSYALTRRHSSLPDAVAALLERRLHRLSSECQTLLGKAAVLGGSFELQQLLPMAQEFTEDAVLDLLDEVLQEGLLTEEGTGAHITYHFWHPLIVSHLYERLSAARRAQLHRRAAETLKATQIPSVQGKIAAAIFNHLKKGGGDIQEIAYYAELAGNQAYSLTAYVEAHYYYLQAILAIVEMSIVGAITDQDIAHYISAHLLAPSRTVTQKLPHLCRLLELTAYCNMILGRFEEARTLYECILSVRTSTLFQQHVYASFEDRERAQQQEAQVQALLWREIVFTWRAIGAYDKAHASCHNGKEVLRQASITECTAWACLHLLTGNILRFEGNYHEARRYFQEATAMLEKFIKRSSQQVPSLLALVDGEIQTEQERAAPLLTGTERALRGDPADLAYGYEQLGIVEASMGQTSEAERYMLIALREYEQQKRVSDMVRVSGNLGAVYIIKGKHGEAKKILQRALDLAERSGNIPNMVFITGNLGDIAHRFGDLLGAEAWFKRSATLAERINDREHISWCHAALADVQRDLGYLSESAMSLRLAIQVGRAIKNPRCIRIALVSLGDLRIVEAIIACKQQAQETELCEQPSPTYQRLLQRAKSTLQRAIAQEGVEMETIIDGKLLLATVHFLRDDLTTAKQTALQTLQDAQQQETIRVIGRAQRLLGRILTGQGAYDEADVYFEQALQIFREQELHLDYARTLHSYGIALVQRTGPLEVVHQHPEYLRGLEYLREAHAFFNTTHATIDFSWANLALLRYATPKVEEGVS